MVLTRPPSHVLRSKAIGQALPARTPTPRHACLPILGSLCDLGPPTQDYLTKVISLFLSLQEVSRGCAQSQDDFEQQSCVRDQGVILGPQQGPQQPLWT